MFLKNNLFKILLLILAVSFTAKFLTGYQIRDSFLDRGNSNSDLNPIAFNLENHHEFSRELGMPSVDFEPLYPIMMSVAYLTSGENWIGLTIMQAILHTLTSLLIFFIGKKIWNSTAGFFAAVFHAFYPYLFSYSISIYDTTLFIFILMAILYLAFKDNLKTIHFVLMGILFGLGFLTRGTVITFIPPVFLFLFYKLYKEKGIVHGVIQLTILITAIVVTMSPWLIRNYNYTGRWLVSTHGPFGLWQGNNEFTYDYLSKDISLDDIYRRNPVPVIYQKHPMTSHPPMEAVQAADDYKQAAVKWIKNNPQMFLKLSVLKAEKLWSWNRNPKSSSLKLGSNESRQTVNLISYLPLLLSFPFGLYFLYKKNKAITVTIIGILICFTATHMIVMGFTRARLPIDPLLMICFGIVADTLIQKYFGSHKTQVISSAN